MFGILKQLKLDQCHSMATAFGLMSWPQGQLRPRMEEHTFSGFEGQLNRDLSERPYN
jgi:hypothetical protein